jgi:hypothetical protein
MNAGLARRTSLAGAGDRCDHDNIYNEHRECSYQRRIAGIYDSHEAADEANNDTAENTKAAVPAYHKSLRIVLPIARAAPIAGATNISSISGTVNTWT